MPITCVPSARPNYVGVRTWGWKPQAIVLRAFSTRGSSRDPRSQSDHMPVEVLSLSFAQEFCRPEFGFDNFRGEQMP